MDAASTEALLDRLDARVARFGGTGRPLLRAGLGVTILLAGGHKLLAPGAWHASLADPLLAAWPVGLLPLDPVFVVFGLSEVVFGVLLLVDWHTPTVALLTGLSLLGVVANLAVGVALGAPFWDVLIRDLGLTVLAFGVAVDGNS